MLKPDAGSGCVTLEEEHWRKMVVDITVGGRGEVDVNAATVVPYSQRAGKGLVLLSPEEWEININIIKPK
jgi:hypothetical protein